MTRDFVKINGKYINLKKVLVPRKNKTVKDFIREITPNIERVTVMARQNNEKPFKTREDLKKWLITNQEDYPKFNEEIFAYFAHHCSL